MKNDAQHPHLKESEVLISSNKVFMWWQPNDFGVTVIFTGSPRISITSLDAFVSWGNQHPSLCSDEWRMLKKNHHLFCIKKLNQLRAIPTSRMLINNLTNLSPALREHRNQSETVQTSVHPVNISMLVLTHIYSGRVV